ncbi:class I SAM-dependent methyltransferase [Glutamicibacter sp. PS]|uniref:class I SAM-dependent methyltransferase n=1 Tax=Glutamicibacter sp. PS TaxID=3075634 RepID=UPI002852047E|nr:class I SAM-dependent methyltransferase [Glutamicibacter sp. PS]MDR4534601.1 SAM-dependent methyltransferase [Glutamicibacter sp. PS]
MYTSNPVTTEPTVASSDEAQRLLESLHQYRRLFTEALAAYDGSTGGARHLEQAIATYARLITSAPNEARFTRLLQEGGAPTEELVDELRALSARCAGVLEKYRALRLLNGQESTDDYFMNVESCIEQEFGAMTPDEHSKVLLIGSGSYPMTLLHLAQQTGARTLGIDIDAEAVELGRRVVQQLGSGLHIRLEQRTAAELEFTAQATHLVFSSTVAAKYELLDELYAHTREDVVVAMRFGDSLKSLFNYPMQPVNPQRWQLVHTIRQEDQVFDIALYAKARPQAKDG